MIGLPIELRGLNTIKKIMSQTGMVLRIDQRNEKIVKGLFLRVCLEVDLS